MYVVSYSDVCSFILNALAVYEDAPEVWSLLLFIGFLVIGIDHADTKQKPLMGPDCLLGVVPQPTGSRLSETNCFLVIHIQIKISNK